MEIVSELFRWSEVKTNLKETIHLCMHCVVSRTGKPIPRPFSIVSHESEPHGEVHADFWNIALAEQCEMRYSARKKTRT